VKKAWLAAWIGGAAIGVANGVFREVTYGERLGEPRAGRLSALSAITAFAGYFRFLDLRWPLRSPREALGIGGIWLALTVCFEFSFGRLVARKSWLELAAEYNLSKGKLWPVVLAWIALGPELVRRAGATSRFRGTDPDGLERSRTHEIVSGSALTTLADACGRGQSAERRRKGGGRSHAR
jgi:hypothetical protein